jgi:replication-associated recombination protein RarA
VPRAADVAIAGLDDVIAQLREVLLWPVVHPALFDAGSGSAVRGVLLHGPPGVGKTACTRAVLQEARAHVPVSIFTVDAADVRQCVCLCVVLTPLACFDAIVTSAVLRPRMIDT